MAKMENQENSPAIIIAVLLMVAGILFLLYYYVYLPPAMQSSGAMFPGHFTCGVDGCEENSPNGEYLTASACESTCQSYVIKDKKCERIQGVPWDSYATKEVCKENLD